jgi:glycosyltransferase involved in cell wall biosynthesis
VQKTISIVTPFYNEQEGIAVYYRSVCDVMAKVPGCDFEIVCVDDGSRDETLKRLVALSEKDARVQVIELSRNFGKEAALTAGLEAAQGDAVIPFDADLQDPPELIPQMIEAWRQGAEIVLARRTDRSSDSYLKRKTAAMFYSVHNRLSTVRIPENVGDFRLMDRVVVEAVKQLPEQQRFMKGLFAWVGFKTETLDYTRNARAAGTTKFSGFRLWNLALEGITSFSSVPLRVWSYVGLVFAVITMLYAGAVIYSTVVHGIAVPGYASLLVFILFFGSIQLISVGVLGEYIGRIYMETKGRPLFLVRRRYGAKRPTRSQ